MNESHDKFEHPTKWREKIMSEKNLQLMKMVVLGSLIVILLGCASSFMKGGTLVPAKYTPRKVLVMYKAEGIVPPNVVYQLVDTEWGEAMFEKSPDGSGAVFLLRWEDEKGVHFGGWVAKSNGYEFVVPLDRTKNVKKYVYPAGTFRYEKVGTNGRLVPTMKIDPVATLIPQ
jgi:hypothetical protein